MWSSRLATWQETNPELSMSRGRKNNHLNHLNHWDKPQDLLQTPQYLLHLSVDALTHLRPTMSDQNRSVLIDVNQSSGLLHTHTHTHRQLRKQCHRHITSSERLLQTWFKKLSANAIPYLMGMMAMPLFFQRFCWLNWSTALRRALKSDLTLQSSQQRSMFSGLNSIL